MASTTALWGTFLVLLGIQIIVKSLFGFEIPLIRTIFGAIVIYVGFMIATDQWNFFNYSSFFHSHNYSNSGQKHTVSLGSQHIDLNDITADQIPQTISVKTIFGSTYIKLNPELSTQINAHATYGSIALPDGTSLSHGKKTLFLPEKLVEKPDITLKLKANYGSITIEE